jgi:hypothetical protein
VDLSPADGGPLRHYWDSFPAHVHVNHMWPTGDGKWVVAIDQTFEDLSRHTAIWLLAADGNGSRLACAPVVSEVYPAIAEIDWQPAIAPDAIYVMATSDRVTQIVRVPR